MKKIKYCILGLSLTTIGFLAGGCADSVNANNNYGFTFSRVGRETNITSYVMVDEETGVNYIVLDRSGGGTAIIPRFKNASGGIYFNR